MCGIRLLSQNLYGRLLIKLSNFLAFAIHASYIYVQATQLAFQSHLMHDRSNRPMFLSYKSENLNAGENATHIPMRES